ncbi:MAG TPA: hypothetical protein VIH48_03905 [Candidatus Bathyarchaeia archaeon]|nr:hypothetical protein [Candidatus Bathyarchaeia archaeon]
MKILHYQHMGVGVILTQALRRLGVESHVLSAAPHPFGFNEDFLLPRRAKLGRPLRYFDWKRFFKFDILHSHHTGRLPSFVQKHWKSRLIQHYHDPNTTKHLYGYEVPSFVSLPSLLKVVPEATWIPLPVDTARFSPEKLVAHEGVNVGYCAQQVDPVKQPFIPIAEIKSAIEESNKALDRPLEKVMNHNDMESYYALIDIWVDRVGLGFYGFSAIEAAAMGIPVITQIGEDASAFVPSCPFINAKKKQFVEREILRLVEDDDLRRELGARSRDYVARMHDSLICAKLCLEKYQAMYHD